MDLLSTTPPEVKEFHKDCPTFEAWIERSRRAVHDVDSYVDLMIHIQTHPPVSLTQRKPFAVTIDRWGLSTVKNSVSFRENCEDVIQRLTGLVDETEDVKVLVPIVCAVMNRMRSHYDDVDFTNPFPMLELSGDLEPYVQSEHSIVTAGPPHTFKSWELYTTYITLCVCLKRV